MGKKNRYSNRENEINEEIREEEVTTTDEVVTEEVEETTEVENTEEIDITEEVFYQTPIETDSEVIKPVEEVVVDETPEVITEVDETPEVEETTEEEAEVVEVESGKLYIEIAGLVNEGKKCVAVDRIRSIGFTKVVDEGKSILVGPYATKEDAICMKRTILRKGLKGNIVER